MKIIHVTDSMEVGGAETVVALLCRSQREEGYFPSVQCLYRKGSIGEKLEGEGFQIELHRQSSLPGLMRSLYQGFREHKPDVVHCHNATAAIMAAIPARMTGTRCVLVTRHGLVRPPYATSGELKFAIASRFCDWLIAVCDAEKQKLLASPFSAQDRVVRVYNGSRSMSTSSSPVIPKRGFTLLHVGRLVPVKQQEELLRAFALAKSRVSDLQLWIVGDGPLRSKLQELSAKLGIEAATRFWGEQATVAPFYCAADLFVMSSLSEGLPMVLLEAMSAGLPAVVPAVGGMVEIAKLSPSVVAVPNSSHELLANAICEVVRDGVQYHRLKEEATECYETHFTVERMCSQYMNLYKCSRSVATTSPDVSS
jgi:L-malate glycosyltransferase